MSEPDEPVSTDVEAYHQDRQRFLAALQASQPVVAAVRGYGRAWLVTRHADVRAVLVDPRLAKDVRRWPGGGRHRPSEGTGVGAHMLHADPPEHARLRRLVRDVLRPRVLALRPRVEQVTTDLLEEIGSTTGVIDLVARYARPLPVAVLAELLGIPRADRPWLAATVAAFDSPNDHDRVEAELAAYLGGLVVDRRRSPTDDLLCDLANDVRTADTADTAPFTDEELVSALYLLVMAGFDTTANLLASGTLALLTHRDEWRRLRDDPALLPGAVEELLRFTGPVNHANDRFTTTDVLIGEVTVPAGEWVLPMIGAAGRDPARFDEADRLDVRRDARGHLAFGHGVHHCLGADLARLEAEIGFRGLLTRFPDLRLAVDPADVRWRPVSLMSGLEALPVRLA